MIKILIFLTLSLSSLAKESVLVAFNGTGSLDMTTDLIHTGMDLARSTWKKEIQDKYEIVKVNVDGSLKGTTQALEDAIKKYRPVLIFGAITSNQAFLINAVSLKHKIPFITPFATHPRVTKSNPFAYRLCFDDDSQAQKLAKFTFKKLGKKNGIALVNRNQSYSIGVAKIFEEAFSKYTDAKLKIIYFNKLADINDSLIESLVKTHPDFLLLPSYQIESATLIARLLPHFPKTQFIGPDSWGGGRLFHKIVNRIPQKFVGFYTQHYAHTLKTKENTEFRKILAKNPTFKDYSSAAMIAPIAIGFDGLNYIFKVLENKKFKTMTEKIQNTTHNGAVGKIDLKKSQNSTRELYIYKINNESESYYGSIE